MKYFFAIDVSWEDTRKVVKIYEGQKQIVCCTGCFPAECF